MKAIAVNGSPRKKWNTATVLQHALDGAASKGAETEMIHLYDLNYKGCISCFGCKRKDSTDPLSCHRSDELTPVLAKIKSCDVLFVGTPIYMGNVTGELRSFMERLLFPLVSYEDMSTLPFKGNIPVAVFYTANMPEQAAEHSRQMFESNSSTFRMLGGTTEYYACYSTYQFDDYSKYAAGRLNEEERRKFRDEVFPKDCAKAFEIGARLSDK